MMDGRSLLLLLLFAMTTQCHGFAALTNRKNHVIQRRWHLPLRGAPKETADDTKDNSNESDTGASIPNLTISLIKSIVGGGGKSSWRFRQRVNDEGNVYAKCCF